MTGSDEVVAGIRPSMFGGTLRRKKPPVARPPQEKKTEQEVAGADVRTVYIAKYIVVQVIIASIPACIIIMPLCAHAQARYTVVCSCVCICMCVCVCRLLQLLKDQ